MRTALAVNSLPLVPLTEYVVSVGPVYEIIGDAISVAGPFLESEGDVEKRPRREPRVSSPPSLSSPWQLALVTSLGSWSSLLATWALELAATQRQNGERIEENKIKIKSSFGSFISVLSTRPAINLGPRRLLVGYLTYS